MTSSQKLLRVTTLLGFALVCATVLWPSHALPENAPVTLPIETVANYLHAVIEADRDVYTRHVVERLQTKGVVVASENWEQKNTLPLPAQFLMESGRYIAKKGLGIQYRLISLWPINKRNVAANHLDATESTPHRLYEDRGDALFSSGVCRSRGHPSLPRLPQRASRQPQT